MSKKQMADTVKTVASIIAPNTVLQHVAQGVVGTGDTPKVPSKYVQLSETQRFVNIDSADVSYKSKRAFVVALYLTCCEKLGCKPSEHNAQALRLTAKLAPYANLGFSRAKQAILKAGEVRPSTGMTGYATDRKSVV